MRLRISTFILLAAGSVALAQAQTGALAAAGMLDGSFGGGTGLVTTLFNPASPINTDYAFDLVVQPDGKLVVAGWASDISDPADFALARYNPDGSLDSSFGGTGLVRAGFGSFSIEEGFALLREPNGKLVVGGWAASSPLDPSVDFVLMRFLPNGQPDPAFGTGGKVKTNLGADDWVLVLARAADGKLLAGGRSGPVGSHNFALARFLPNGALDTTFGTAGKVVTDFSGRDDSIEALVVLPDGRILAAGPSGTGPTGGPFKMALARYTKLGKPDPTFGTSGKTLLSFGQSSAATALALLAGGKFLVGGGIAMSGGVGGAANMDFAVLRFNSNGKLDPTFGTAGRVTTDFAHKFDGVDDLRVLGNGKIVVAGQIDESHPGAGDGAMGLARYSANGQLDSTFGTAGRVRTHFPGSVGSSVEAMEIQANGRIVVVGPVFPAFPAIGVSFGVARYLN
ncbi:MAG TPA: hypothetical protein VN851_17130 [Thermoanaerobaculia bacterium]|nr:hypothetical protein [Thermoanaerobaculia bacterium]